MEVLERNKRAIEARAQWSATCFEVGEECTMWWFEVSWRESDSGISQCSGRLAGTCMQCDRACGEGCVCERNAAWGCTACLGEEGALIHLHGRKQLQCVSCSLISTVILNGLQASACGSGGCLT